MGPKLEDCWEPRLELLRLDVDDSNSGALI